MGMLHSDPRPRVVTGPSRTKQEFKAECDINNILRRFVRDRFVTHLSRTPPRFLDVSEVSDFRTAVDQVRAAEEYFAGLPAKVRARFGNDVVRYLDEGSKLTREELRELGLAELRVDDTRQRRRVSDKEGASPRNEEAPGTVSS